MNEKGIGSIFSGIASTILKAFTPISYVTQALGGFMEVFEPLGELMENVGQILGQALAPTVNALVQALLPLLPVLIAIVQGLAPLILLLMQFTSPVLLLAPAIASLTQYIPQITQFFTDLPSSIVGGLEALGNIIGEFFTKTLPNFIFGFITNIGNAISGWWNDIGTSVTGGGADKSGWW